MKQQHKLTVGVKGLVYNLDSSNKTASVGINSEASGDVIIPDTIRYKNADFAVTGIGEDAFYCANLTSVIIGNSVSNIGKNAFVGCHGLTSVIIPNSVTNISVNPFQCCSHLESIAVENGNTVYNSNDNCNAIIETATNTLISGCKNTIIPNSITRIGDRAFRGCKELTSMEIPLSVTNIGERAFWGCRGLTLVAIPDFVTSIGNAAFVNCSRLTSVTIPNSATSIAMEAFLNCECLTSVEIPNSVTTIGDYAFCGAELTSMFCKAETPPYAKQAFSNNLSKATLYVPIGCADIYKQTYPWSTFGNIVEIDFYGVQGNVEGSTPTA